MNIHEYQAKNLLNKYGICVPNGQVIFDANDAELSAWKIESDIAVVKAQIHAGGRGKAGGVKIAKSIDEVKNYASNLLNSMLKTHQTGTEGKLVQRVLIEEGCEIDHEYYIGLVLDRTTSRIAIIASEDGGMDIETIASDYPHRIFKVIIDPMIGLTSFQARSLAMDINIPINLVSEVVSFMFKLYKCFIENDCTIAEINPLVTTKDNRVMALDAKLNFDDNALFRQKDVLKLRDYSEEDSKETEASKHDLSYIALDGNIGCMVNGAGLAMATMDIIQHYGGMPANFLDVGGGATAKKVAEAFKIILSDSKVEGVFVNIFGGIMKCDLIAEGIVQAAKEINLEIPLVVRLEGTNVKIGQEILRNSNLKIETVNSMDQGARLITSLLLKH